MIIRTALMVSTALAAVAIPGTAFAARDGRDDRCGVVLGDLHR